MFYFTVKIIRKIWLTDIYFEKYRILVGSTPSNSALDLNIYSGEYYTENNIIIHSTLILA